MKGSLKEERLKCEYIAKEAAIYIMTLQTLSHFPYYYIILIKTLTCWLVLLNSSDVSLKKKKKKIFWCACEILFSDLWYDGGINIWFKIFTLKLIQWLNNVKFLIVPKV